MNFSSYQFPTSSDYSISFWSTQEGQQWRNNQQHNQLCLERLAKERTTSQEANGQKKKKKLKKLHKKSRNFSLSLD